MRCGVMNAKNVAEYGAVALGLGLAGYLGYSLITTASTGLAGGCNCSTNPLSPCCQQLQSCLSEYKSILADYENTLIEYIKNDNEEGHSFTSQQLSTLSTLQNQANQQIQQCYQIAKKYESPLQAFADTVANNLAIIVSVASAIASASGLYLLLQYVKAKVKQIASGTSATNILYDATIRAMVSQNIITPEFAGALNYTGTQYFYNITPPSIQVFYSSLELSYLPTIALMESEEIAFDEALLESLIELFPPPPPLF